MLNFNSGSSYLQTQISSGFDSVTQGITQTSTISGPTGLQSAYDSFASFETTEMGDFGAMGAQQLAPSADFSSPATYMSSQVFDSAFQNTDSLLRAVQDSHLATGDELSKVSGILSKFTSEAERQGIIIVSGSPTQAQQKASSRLEQAGVFAPPQKGGSPELEQAGLITPPQFGGSMKLDQAGLITPPQISSEPHAPSGMFAQLQQQGITFSTQNATTLASMSTTVSEAASLFQAANLSMLNRKIIG